MIEKLVVDFFKKIEEKEGIKKTNGKSIFFIEELIQKKHGKVNYIDKQKATRLQKKYIDKDPKASASLDDTFLKNIMAIYLGYKDYNDFATKHTPSIPPPNGGEKRIDKIIEYITKNWKKIIGTISIASIPLLGTFFLTYNSLTNEIENCILWNGKQYEETTCDTYKAIDNSKETININIFKRIEVNKNTIYFKEGKNIVWYGKNYNGKIEYFNSRGEHPETKVELKPITRHFLNKQGLLNEY